MAINIPFNRAALVENEVDYVRQALESNHISGDGAFTAKCHAYLERELEVRKALLTTSCTHALELAALLLDIREGEEVIVPSFTFVSTINAFVLRGAKPRFVDVRPDTLNLDEAVLEPAITPNTKAIVPVHYGGVGCEMDAILRIANRHGIAVVEDNAHGLFGKYKGRYLGTFGVLATQSFHETKNFSCGEGGALLINDTDLVERAEILREKGTNRSRFFRGLIDKYSWVDIGSSYLPADILAAILYAQFEARERIQSRRAQIWHQYMDGLRDWARERGFSVPFVPEYCEHTSHVFYMLAPDLATRQALIGHLRERGILCVFHYLPLHLSDMGRRFGGKPGDCPVTESITDRLLRLPFYFQLTDDEQERVIRSVRDFKMP